MTDIAQLIRRRDRARFAEIGDLQPGTLQSGFTRCGKKNCRCATDDEARHGPHYLINRSIDGHNRSTRVRADELDDLDPLLKEYQHFKQVSAEFLKASEALSEARRQLRREQGGSKKNDAPCAGRAQAWDALAAPALADKVESLVRRALFEEGDFEAMEHAVRDLGMSWFGRMVAHCINANHRDCRDPETACPDCGQPARHAGRRDRTLVTTLGVMVLRRAWYHCRSCHAGLAPRDRELHLKPGSLSPAVTRMVGVTAGQVSFGRSSHLIKVLAGIDVGTKTVERHAESLGRRIASDEAEVIDPEDRHAPTLDLGLDGTGVPVRKTETAGRQGKQDDGSTKTREVKLACVWSAESLHAGTGRPQRDAGSVSYNARSRPSHAGIPTRRTRTLPDVHSANCNGDASRMSSVVWSSETARPGSGTTPTCMCPMPSRWWMCIMPRSMSATPPRRFTGTPTSPGPGAGDGAMSWTARVAWAA